jgi:N utilization substance protein B
MPGNRRKSRELAMQALYYMDITRGASEEKLTLFCRSRSPSERVKPFFVELVRGVVQARVQIDAVIERFSSHWKIHRMSAVDRNILRIAVYEMFVCSDIPTKVSLNEAIELGKKFGTEESGAFINGILDSIHMAMEKGEIEFDVVRAAAVPLPEREEEGLPSGLPDGEKPNAFVPVRGKRGVVKRTSRKGVTLDH